MSIIDFHMHILPEIDDGSRSLPVSMEMWEVCREARVDVLVATPHFYGNKQRMEQFLEDRAYAFERLQKAISKETQEGQLEKSPRLVLGAETAYFQGISKADGIRRLLIGETDTLLLELPFCPWDEEIVDEVLALKQKGMHVLLAHVERYIGFKGNMDILKYLKHQEICFQVNAGSLKDWKMRRHIGKMIRKNWITALGSDSHGMHRRPPNLMEGRDMIEKKIGREYLDNMDQSASQLLNIGRE